jgi:iron complex outermembrane receptor protein
MRGDVDLGFATAASITAFRSNEGLAIADLDASPANLVTFVNNVNQATFTQEFQLASTTSTGIQWIGGLFLYFDDAALDPTTQMAAPFANLPQSTRVLYDRQDTQSYAPFGQVTIPFLADTTRLTVGARYTADKRSFEYRIQTVTGAISSSANPPPSTWPKLTWRLSLDHDFAPDILGYVSYNRGFKSGNYNLNGPTQPPVFPEVIDAYEIGMKTELFDGRARLNWSAYYYDITDKQVQSATLGGNIQTNAAAAEHKGIDVDLMFLPTEHLTVAMGLAFLDAKYTKFPGATFNFPCLTPTTAPACAASVNGGGYYSLFQDASGLRPHYTERSTGTLSVNYTVPASFGDLQFIGSVAYHDGFFFDVQNILEQPSYTIANASVVWSAPSDKWDVTLWGKNLTGEEYFAQQQVNQNGAVYAPQPPRSYGITFGYHFDNRGM